MITKEEPDESNTRYAQGGIAAVMDPQDSLASHVQDTLASGDGLCDPAAVEQIVRDGPGAVQELIDIGVRFTRRASSALSLGREGGHAAARVVHAEDMTGQELVRVLLSACRQQGRVQILPDHMGLELRIDAGGRCQGVQALDRRGGRRVELSAPVVLLASGGCGQIYLHTTNPPVATGDGVAMAYRAGARVGNLEFVQFHPTMFHDPGGEAFLISEAVRGYGGVLVNHRGERFVDARHPLGSLATRDVVARAIVDELRQSGRECVYLDVTGKEPEAIRKRFPNIHRHCLSASIDMTREPIPVVPAAHYMCGGVLTDLQGRTDIDGLYAAGEVAMTGLHGANRLASNSLLEALVLAGRAFADSCGQQPTGPAASSEWKEDGQERAAEEEMAGLRARLRRCTWEKVGIVRDDCGLEAACRELEEIRIDIEALYQRHMLEPELAELRNMATVAELVARSARLREESRGGHFNRDHPGRDDSRWQVPTLLRNRE